MREGGKYIIGLNDGGLCPTRLAETLDGQDGFRRLRLAND